MNHRTFNRGKEYVEYIVDKTKRNEILEAIPDIPYIKLQFMWDILPFVNMTSLDNYPTLEEFKNNIDSFTPPPNSFASNKNLFFSHFRIKGQTQGIEKCKTYYDYYSIFYKMTEQLFGIKKKDKKAKRFELGGIRYRYYWKHDFDENIKNIVIKQPKLDVVCHIEE